MSRGSITRQLTLLMAAFTTLILIAIGIVMGVLVDEHFVMLDVEMLEMEIARAPRDLDAGSVYNATPEIGVAPQLATLVPRTADHLGTTMPLTWREGMRTYRGLAHRLPAAKGDGFFTIVAAADISPHVAFGSMLWKILAAAVIAGIALSVLMAWFAARRGTAPLREVAALAAAVSAERLAQRLPADRVPVELLPLTESFNAMLARLEDSFRRLSEFSADLAHELRTPITNVMTQTQVAVSRPRDAEEYREVLYSNLEEFQQLSHMVEDMLLLARSEHGAELPDESVVDLAREADAVIEFFEPVAGERGLVLERVGEGAVRGDRSMVRRAMANLVSNAIRHGLPDSAVRIAIAREGGDIVAVAVENHGSDIPAAHLARVFDRFYRVDAARRRAEGGSGLGLAISKAIAQAHHGSISAESAGGVTRFTLRFGRAVDDRDVMGVSSPGPVPGSTLGAS